MVSMEHRDPEQAVPLHVFLMVLASAAMHATWNFIVRSSKGNVALLPVARLSGSLVLMPFGIAFSDGTTQLGSPYAWLCIAATGIIHFAYRAGLGYGYRAGDISVVYPIARGTGVALTAVLSVPLLGDALNLEGACGIAGVCLGVVMIGWPRRKGTGKGGGDGQTGAEMAAVAARHIGDGDAIADGGLASAGGTTSSGRRRGPTPGEAEDAALLAAVALDDHFADDSDGGQALGVRSTALPLPVADSEAHLGAAATAVAAPVAHVGAPARAADGDEDPDITETVRLTDVAVAEGGGGGAAASDDDPDEATLRATTDDAASPGRRPVPVHTAALMAGGVGISISSYSLVDSVGVTLVDPLLYICFMGLVELVVGLPLLWWYPTLRVQVRQAVTTHRRNCLLVAVLSPATYLIVLFAFREADVAVVAALRESSVVMGALLGHFVLGEPLGRRKVAGLCAVVAGVVLVKLA